MIGVTVKLIILYIVLSIAISAIPSWGVLASQWALDNWGPLWTIAWQALLFAFLAVKIPTMAQNALTGSASLSPGEALQIAATAIAAGVGAAAGAGKMAGSALDATYGAAKKAPSLAAFNRNSINPLDDMRSPKSSNANIQMPWDTSSGTSAPNKNSMYEPLDHSKIMTDWQAKSKDTGNASGASIGDDKNKKPNQDNSRSKTDSIKSAIETVGRIIPNDQAAAGGDLVKNHKD
jgi:type IV secretion system protein TrbL